MEKKNKKTSVESTDVRTSFDPDAKGPRRHGPPFSMLSIKPASFRNFHPYLALEIKRLSHFHDFVLFSKNRERMRNREEGKIFTSCLLPHLPPPFFYFLSGSVKKETTQKKEDFRYTVVGYVVTAVLEAKKPT